jgi:phage major head subunit gpT-like protein
MLINPANLDFLFYQAEMRFQAAYQNAPIFYDKVSSEIPSSTRENHYGWLGRLPGLREWIGERQVNNLAARGYVIQNKDFEGTIGIKRPDVEDDQFGLFNLGVEMLGMQAKLWPERQVVNALQSGHTTAAAYAAFDGQPFFSTAHPVNPDSAAAGTFSNYSASALALTSANYQTARQTMMAYTGEDGNPLGIVPNVLMVPPQLEAAGRQILNADFTAPAAAVGQNAASIQQSNVLKGSAELVVNPYLSNQGTTWYLFSTQFPIRPLIWQLRKAPQLIAKTDPGTDESVWRLNEFQYGVDSRGNVGFSLPFLAYKAAA